MHRLFMLAVLLLVFAFNSPAAFSADKEDSEGRGWALDAKAGTLGFGADINRSIVPRVMNLRVGASFFSYSADISEDEIDYRAKLKLGAVPIAVDVFPFKNWFRLGGGIQINLNEVTATTASNGTVTIGDHQYNIQDFGQLEGKVKFNRVAPYFGIGFNNPIKRKGRLGFFADLGFMYHGTPTATLTPSRLVPGLQEDIARETQEINDDLKDYPIYPVIQLGISYRF